jgi:hypothetical protein
VYSRGALYHLLNNRIYVGEIVHRGQAYPGEHEPIVPRQLWDRVAARLQANSQARRTGKPRSTSSLLTGILRDTNGIRFTPTHAVKSGRRYRYYTSQAVIQHRGDAPSVTRFPARELESIVMAEIHRLLEAPDKYLTGLEATVDVGMAAERAHNLARQWSKTGLSQQRAFLKDVLKGVVVGQKNIWIEVDRATLITNLLGGSREGLAAITKREPDTIQLTVGLQSFRRGAELRIHAPSTDLPDRTPVPSLVKALARARGWYERLITGKAGTVEQLAKKTGLTSTYVNRILQCALLSPEVTDAILSGQQGHHLTLTTLLQHLPLDWRQQKSKFLSVL